MSETISNTAGDPRWRRILARERSADGEFWYSVTTTGVYCRPSCASRSANPRNVTVHATLAEARATGARACLRCDPEGDSERARAASVARACRAIEEAEQAPALAALAEAAGMSAGHFHRLFKHATGLTPKAYAVAYRAARLRDRLAGAASVTDAIYAAGFGSNGRFYAKAAETLGMTPTRYRAGGARETLRFAVGECTLGAILVASSDTGVAAILIGDAPEPLVEDLQDRFPAAELVGGDAGYEALVAQVIGFVEAPGTGLGLPLDVRGTAFQQRVWRALQAVEPGRTTTYGAIAAEIGVPRAIRAVAGACAANAHAVAIPCHRVVRRDGALSGYRWGVERKRRLIALEGAA